MDRVYMRHIREAHMCSRGVRQVAKEQGFDYEDFLVNGIDIEILRRIDDAMIQEVVQIAEADVGDDDVEDAGEAAGETNDVTDGEVAAEVETEGEAEGEEDGQG